MLLQAPVRTGWDRAPGSSGHLGYSMHAPPYLCLLIHMYSISNLLLMFISMKVVIFFAVTLGYGRWGKNSGLEKQEGSNFKGMNSEVLALQFNNQAVPDAVHYRCPVY